MSYKAKQRLVSEKFVVRDLQSKKTSNGKDFLVLNLVSKEGQINGMVWEDRIPLCQIALGKVHAIDGLVDEYKGGVNLIVDATRTLTDEPKSVLPTERSMVFDIECVGNKYEDLNESQQEYLVKNLGRSEEEEAAKLKTGLFYIFGKVCSIGIYCPETGTGKVMAWSDKEITPEKADYSYEIYKTEKELLEAFWKEALEYTRYVGYNCDNFDWPYLIMRSGINKVVVSIPVRRHDGEKWIDLQNIYKQGQAFKLEQICLAFGVENPKEEGVSGLHVQELFWAGNHQTIADYVARDAYSTSLLYSIYRQYLKGIYI